MPRGRRTLIIVAVCVMLILLVAAFAFLHRLTTPAGTAGQQETTLASGTETEGSAEPDAQTQPTGAQETTTPTNGQNGNVQDEEVSAKPEEGDVNTPPVVVIPDPDPEQAGLQFPCEVPGHDLKIERLAPYTGMFVEDGTNTQVTDVAMILLCNTGDKPVEYTEITVKFAEETLVFQITALPAGERMVVQEKNGKSIPDDKPVEASALVVHRAKMAVAPELSVQDNGDNSLTIKNLTDQTIPTVRVFYKYYMEKEDLFVGGIAFTLRVTNLPGNGSLVVNPAHFVSANSRVVMALTYDS